MALPLHGHTFELDAADEVSGAAASLLERLGARHRDEGRQPTLGAVELAERRGPTMDWAESGAMALTGRSDGPPLVPDAPIAERLRAAQAVLALLSSGVGRRVEVDVLALLGERAALAGLTRRGSSSVGAAARLIRARDGWVVVNLARQSDVESIPAWLGLMDLGADPWPAVAAVIAQRDAGEVVERAQLLGIAVALVPAVGAMIDDPQLVYRGQRGFPAPWVIDDSMDQATAQPPPITRRAPIAPIAPIAPLVVDLSPLWAGPLCAHLLGLAGGRVIKVESPGRPDAMRRGNSAFFDLLHAGHESVALDLATAKGRRMLRELVLQADVVIEESRPRALAQMGIDLLEVMSARPALTWISITGYGRSGPWSNGVAFGDDAAAAAGLVLETERGTPVFCADAIADPITGVFAAVGGLASILDGGGHLIDVPLREASGYACGGVTRPTASTAERRGGGWVVQGDTESTLVREPRARRGDRAARPFSADTTAVLSEFGIT